MLDERKAVKLLEGLKAPQKERLDDYAKHLSKDRFDTIFDDKVINLLKNYAWKEQRITSTTRYLDKIGFSRAIYRYDEMEKHLRSFEAPDHPYFGWNRNFKKAKADLISELGGWRLEPLRYLGENGVRTALPRLDTHAGWSFITTGLRKKGEYVGQLYTYWRQSMKHVYKEGSFNKPILVGTRTQASGAFNEDGSYTYKFKDKTRMVSMVDIVQIISECIFSKPFQAGMAYRTKWYAGGKDDGDIHSYMISGMNNYKYSISIDYSSFDQSISSWLIEAAFDVIKSAFMPITFDDKLFQIIKRDFICKAFIDGRGRVRYSKKGVPSGSMFTQIVDSIVNRLVIDTYLLSIGVRNKEGQDGRFMCIMGDDNIFFTHVKIDPKHLESYVAKNFGLQVSSEKMSTAVHDYRPTSVEFLSRDWSLDGIGRLPEEVISRLAFPERFRKYRSEYDCVLVLESYIDAFPLSMQELMDVERFKFDYRDERRNRYFDPRWLSGLMQYRARYG